jgi:hypothetical protein
MTSPIRYSILAALNTTTGEETEAYVFAQAELSGFSDAETDAEVDAMLDAGILGASVTLSYPGERHYPTLCRTDRAEGRAAWLRSVEARRSV